MSQAAKTLTHTSPFLPRFMAWVQERFPIAHGALFLVLFAAAAVTGIAATGPGPINLDLPRLGLGFLGAWSFFLMLRVFDEHKDFERDRQNHPHRVLQRGLITLGHLKAVGAVAIGAQLLASLVADGGVGAATLSWGGVMLWSALMAREFGVGPWLEKRLVLYAVSHMVVMPMAITWMALIGSQGEWVTTGLPWLALMAFCAGAAFEVTRKTRAPQEERETVDSYARSLGLRGASVAIITFLVIGAAGQLMLLQTLTPEPLGVGWIAAVIGLLVPPLVAVARFVAAPSVRRRKRNEAAVSLAMLGGYAVVVAALLVERGVAWV